MQARSLSSFSIVAFTLALVAASERPVDAREGCQHGSKAAVVDDYKITILSDAIPGRNTMSEWGFSALIEVTTAGVTKRFLFDTGDKPATVLNNATTLGINLCEIEDVVISHHHADHTGGLDNLRKTCAAKNPNAFSKAHVGAPEIFWSRITPDGKEKNPMVKEKGAYEAQGGKFVINDQPHEFLMPGVFLTGRIARTHDEKTYTPVTPMQIQDPSGRLAQELVPEDQSLVINTAAGVVVLTGCGHAGAVNTVEQAVRMVGGGRPNVILAGGLHLYEMEQGDMSTVGTLDWEALSMAELNVVAMLGGHCTGFERFVYVREYLGLDQSRAGMAAVGTVLSINPRFSFTLPQAFNMSIPAGRQHDGHRRGHRE